LQLTVSPTGSTGLSEDLRAGRLDLALMGLPAAELDGLNASTLLDTRCVAVLPLDHALATASTLSLAQLSGESFVDTPRGFGNRVVIDREYERQQLRRRVTTEVTDLRSVATFVAAGLGVAILPAGITQPVPGTVHITLEPPAITWTLSIVRRRTEHPSRAVSALLTLLDTWPIGVPAPPGASYL
jgi:DNA-binding transcriptional LysR family regulator